MMRRRAPVAVLVAALLLTAVATWVTARATDDNRQRQFDRLAESTRRAVESTVDRSTEVLRGVRSLFAQGPVSRTQFRDYIAAVDMDRLPGMQAISFNRRVAAHEVAAYEAVVAADPALGAPYAVRPPAEEAGPDDRYVIEYIEPLAGNERALGFDIGSDPRRRAAVEEARDTGELIATRGIDLVQFREERGEGRGFLVLVALYDNAADPRTAPERRRAFQGVVVSVIHLDEMLSDVLRARSPVAVEIYDVGPTVAGARDQLRAGDLLFDNDDVRAALTPEKARTPNRFLDMDVGGRRWRIFAEAEGPLPGGPSDAPTWMVAIGGVAISVLAAAAVRSSARARVRRSREMLEGYLRFTPDAVVVAGPTGEILHANERAGQMFGYPHDELVGAPVEMLVPERLKHAHVAHRAAYAADPRVREMGEGQTLFGRRRDGTDFPVEVALSPLRFEDGTVFAAAIRDVSQRYQASQALREALDREQEAASQLRELDALKDEFLDITAHELRTPLTSILGFTELLLRRRSAMDEQRIEELLARIDANAGEMREMLSRLLDVSRLRAGRVELRPVATDLRSVLEDIVHRPRPSAADHVLSLKVDEEATVLVDTRALDHVLSNLISNAVKFSPPGTPVTVSARRQGDDVVVAVGDEGPGIDAADVPQLFDHFFQGRKHVPGARGVGVGLRIVKRYVDLWGGRVWVDTVLGEGATFSFTIPSWPTDGETDGAAERGAS